MRRRLCALLAVPCLALAGLAGIWAWSGSYVGTLAASAPYVDYLSTREVASLEFIRASLAGRRALGNDTRLVFGTSELYPGGKGPAHPVALLRGRAHGIDVMPVGRAYCESLWQAVELGALAPDVLATGDDRVVVFLSMQWFMPSRNTAADLSTSFSQGALDALMASDTISDEVKARVRARLAAYGTIAEGEDNPVFGAASAVDGAARGAQGRVRLALELASGGPSNGMAGQTDAEVTAAAGDGGGAEPNWDALISEGRALAEADSTSNDAGYADAVWTSGEYDRFLAASRRWRPFPGGGLFSEQEFGDFQLLLDVCQEAGLRPLVVIQANKGWAYDQTAYDGPVREGFRDRVEAMCADAGVEVADFSAYDDDLLFCRDASHPSALGSAYYSRCIYRWFTEGVVDTGVPPGGAA